VKDYWMVTHRKSAPSKKENSMNRWDFLAVCIDRDEALRVASEMPESTGVMRVVLGGSNGR
jgi:hypothetical protein